ncbi:MAG: ATP-binding protein [Coprobacillaceae bacterium]
MSKLFQKIIALSIIGLLLMLWQEQYSIFIFIGCSLTLLFFVYEEQKYAEKKMTKYRIKKNTQLKEVKGENEFSKDLLESLIKTMNMPMIFMDKDGIIAFANSSFMEAFELDDIFDKHYQEAFYGSILDILEKSYVSERKFNTIICVENKYYQIDTTPLFNDVIFNGAIILFTDVSQMKEVERLQKQFFSDISHELKTPMSAIIGSAEILKRDGIKDNDTFDEFMAILLKESYRMQNIINDILELSRLEQPQVSIHPINVDVEMMIKESIEMYEPLAKEKRISLIYQNYIEKSIILDYSTIKTVISNLVSNAVKYSKDGVITIKTREKDNNFILTVQDEGIGIAKDNIPFVFDRFFQVDRSRSKKIGTGLGLSIVKRMVELNKGHITLESEPNIGSTFTVIIPIS